MTTEAKNTTKVTAIDLFSGAGGFSLGAINADINVLAAIEFDKDAAKTYENNIVNKRSKNTELRCSDILEIDPSVFRNDLQLKKGQLDLLIGGPPCQGFSTHRILGSGIDDPRNKLLLRYFDFVKELEPKMFLVENVPGLLWKRHEAYLNDFKRQASEHGYKLFDPIQLNAKDYGVPQNRERVFILGVRETIDTTKLIWPPKQTHFAPNKGEPVWINASTVFDTPPKEKLDELAEILDRETVDALIFGDPVLPSIKDPSAINMAHTEKLLPRIRETPINGSREDISFRLPCHGNKYPGHKDVYGRIKLAQPGPTMTTGCFNPSKGRFLHPWLDHGMTIRHAARFQTFPDDFVFSSGITSQGKQVGNAVPVKLAEKLLGTLQSFLQSTKAPIDK
jgi:DNA (cytosine-5)-methyltransferase 1